MSARSRLAPAALAAAVLVAPPATAAPLPGAPAKTLAQCIEIAIENHPRLGTAESAVEAGRQRVLQARASYLPQVSGSYSTTRQKSALVETPGGFAATSAGGSQPSWFYSSEFSLSQILFDFGQNLDRIRAARAREDALLADETTQRETIVLSVKQSYFDLLAARRLLAVAEETVRSNRQQLDLARGRYEVGFAAKIDVTRSDVQLANSELDLITARNNVAVAEDTLRNALGLRDPLDFDVVDVLDERRVEETEPEALAAAYAARPELASNLAQQRAREEDVDALGKDHLPNLTGNATYGWSGRDYPLRSGWAVGATVVLPLFTGGRTSAQVAEAKADLQALRFEEMTLRNDIALQVRTALLDLRRTSESIVVTERAAAQARENLDLAEGRYRTGVGNVIELTDAQVQRARADADRVRALYSHQIAIAALEKAIGRPLERP